MLQAMLAGVASIKAQQTRMNVIGNNLANINTTAFKSSSVTFQDMIAQTIRGATRPTPNGLGGIDPTQIGLGVTIGATGVNNEQGSLNATNNPTDLAIQGNGFFMVSNGTAVNYTRDGSFTLDAKGDLVSSSTGQNVLGWAADAVGQVDTTKQLNASNGINIPVGLLSSVQQTTQATFSGNLDATALPAATLTTQMTVYDGLGAPHLVSVQFLNHQVPPAGTPPPGATASWDWTAWEGQPGTGTPIGDSSTVGNQSLYYDANGQLLTPAGSFNIVVPPSGGANALPIGLDFSKIGQLTLSSQVNPTGQNGFPPGALSSFNIGNDGLITGDFSNGLTRVLGQIALSVFPNPGGLERTGDNMWGSTDNSGLPVTGAPRSGSNGSISAGFLEQSNVDVGNEFSDLIVTQRGFQANTKVVTTVDQMMQDLINMKQ